MNEIIYKCIRNIKILFRVWFVENNTTNRLNLNKCKINHDLHAIIEFIWFLFYSFFNKHYNLFMYILFIKVKETQFPVILVKYTRQFCLYNVHTIHLNITKV